MIFNYLITALRAFKQQKQHFLLNVIGLSVGLAAAILVALFAKNELSFDKQQPDADRVYRVAQDYSKLGLGTIPIYSYTRGTQALDFSQVEDVFALKMVEFTREAEVDVKHNNEGFKLNNLYAATANIEDFIAMDVLAGNIKEAMSTPNSLALSESEALRIFGTVNVVGETLNHANGSYTVRAVFADLPDNTHFGFQALVYAEHISENLFQTSHYVYLKLTPGTDIPALEKQLTEQAFTGDFKGRIFIELHSILDLHLTAKSPFEMKTGGTKQVVTICVGLSILLVLIASFNFINMTVAQSTKRAKEVGVRKALGASKTQLVGQFLSESVLVAVLSMMLACVLVELVIPSFNNLVDRELVLNYASSFGVGIVIVAIAVGVLAGLYPAFFISSFSAKRVLSGDLQRGSTAIWVRKSLLTFQASLAIGLIIGSATLLQQLSHLQSLPLGYQTAQRLVISEVPVGEVFTQQPSAVVNKLLAIEGVQHLGVIDTQLTRSINNTLRPTWPNGEESGGITPVVGTSFEVVKSLGLELLAGRDFSREFAGDWANRVDGITYVGTIVTETVAKQAGFTNVADILGKSIKDVGRNVDMRVIGVVADVKIGNAQNANTDIMFLLGFNYLNPTSEVVLTVNPQNALSIRQQAAEVLAQHANVFEPKIELLSDSYKAVLRGDERISQVVLIFTALAVFLTCLGTFGLASFAAARRQKEVAVRKVLGASRISIVNILAKEFLVLVGVSIAIAYPVTYLLVGDWLANFNDRIDQTVWVYGIAAIVVAGITWVTVASLAFKAASTRPSLILRYE
ncbi:ABC transporter permease [Pseudoalteromonas phenolica]|uniref:ABC transporter permease n=1 Tax=Pseudoalteromonas phenolica TaxID=161398 RepID=A0A5R9PYK5_9GAMM|nr:ABC transporter permease [Pseudoalteromonas phenolica]TLX45978.1 ABC transporter permease [Pseudoalteromonas phenolica]